MSLYGEVRNQPKAGYLSTIESILFALKAIGENHKGLDWIIYWILLSAWLMTKGGVKMKD
jgi:hypothetical protein